MTTYMIVIIYNGEKKGENNLVLFWWCLINIG